MIRSGGGRPESYRTADGHRVPSVTTITSRYKDPSALIRWANRIGLEGHRIDQKTEPAKDAGHLAHAWIETIILGAAPVLPPRASDETVKRAQMAVDAFRSWREQSKLEMVGVEQPLVSENMRYGGTYDCLARAGDEYCLVDWKTGNSVYPEQIVQQAAYALLVKEVSGISVSSMVLLRLGKVYADFHHHHFGSEVVTLAGEAFGLMRRMYEYDEALKALAR